MEKPIFSNAPRLINIGDAAPPGELYSMVTPQNQANLFMSRWLRCLALGLAPKTRVDRAWRWLAWKIPRRLVYWCAVRLIAHATSGKYSAQEVPALVAIDALNRWEVR